MNRKTQGHLYRVLFFVLCVANFVFLNAFIWYFEDPGRSGPASGSIPAMIVFAAIETVLGTGILYSLMMAMRLRRDTPDEDDLLALPPKVPRGSRQAEPAAAEKPAPGNFEKLVRVLLLIEVVTGILFIGFLVAAWFVFT